MAYRIAVVALSSILSACSEPKPAPEVISAQVFDVEITDTDEIEPTKIIHGSEQIIRDQQLEQDYNYLWYEFETETHIIRARSYLDEIEVVSLFGPFAKDSPTHALHDYPFDPRVISYLSRRYLYLQRLGPEGYISLDEWESSMKN